MKTVMRVVALFWLAALGSHVVGLWEPDSELITALTLVALSFICWHMAFDDHGKEAAK